MGASIVTAQITPTDPIAENIASIEAEVQDARSSALHGPYADVDARFEAVETRYDDHVSGSADKHDAADLVFDPTGLTHTSAADVQNAIADLDAALVSLDCANVAYTPGTLSDWQGAVDPGEVADALDQLASRMYALETSGYDAFPAGTKLLFSGAIPAGWTQDPDAALNGAMLVGTTGVPGSGGSADPKVLSHTHAEALTYPNHSHSDGPHSHNLVSTGTIWGQSVSTGLTSPIERFTFDGSSVDNASITVGPDGGGNVGGTITSASINPKYYEVVVGVKS